MKRSSKNRLLPRHAELFPGEGLFDAVARAVCGAGTLPRKELYEAWEMARRVRRRFRGGRVVDLACGHGLLAHLMLILDNTSGEALAVDKRIPQNAEKLSRTLIDSWPRLDQRVIFMEADLESIEIRPDDLVLSSHGCGPLTDMVLDKAVEKRARVAVLPCCHDGKGSSAEDLAGWMDLSLAQDTLRALSLKSKGYRILTQSIPGDITPKNRLLMGEPDQNLCQEKEVDPDNSL